tara:strand:- start:40 stop:213 length:174 start_codon:yes stop_codon:yes gene_type:complete
MNNVDKLSYSIQKLQPNSEYILNMNDDAVNENVFNSITWVTVNNLTWSEVLDEMEKL